MKQQSYSEREIIFHFQCNDLKIGNVVIEQHALQVQSSAVAKRLREHSFYCLVLSGPAYSVKSRCSKDSHCNELNFYKSLALFLGPLFL